MISLPRRTVAFSLGSKPRIESDVTDLPLPDSPTRATVELVGMSKLMPFTASKAVCLSRRKLTRRLRTVRRVSILWWRSFARLKGRVPANALFQLRIERVAQRVGEQAERGDQQRHRRPRCRELPPLAQYQLVLRLVEHRSPGHDVDRNAEPQEGKDDFGLDERNHQYRKLYQHHVADVREDVHEHPPCVRCADRVRRLNIFAALVLQIFAANQPEAPGPPGQPENQDDGEHSFLLQYRGDGENQQQIRYRRKNAVEPVENVVEPAPIVAGDGAEQGAEKRRHDRRGQTDEDRGLGAF